MSAHPDAELLTVCRQLAEMKAEWEPLYDATSDFGPLTTPEDHAWNDYSNMVWPGIKLACSAFHKHPHPDDVPWPAQGRPPAPQGRTPYGLDQASRRYVRTTPAGTA